MLWTELYVAMLLACIFRLSSKQTLILASAGVFMVLTANVLRASTLIVFDRLVSANIVQHLASREPSVHLGAGLIIFCAVCALTIMAASKLHARMARQPGARTISSATPRAYGRKLSALFPLTAARYFLVSLCLAAAVIPLIAHPTGSTVATEAPPIWPTEINGEKLVAVDSLAEEKVFVHDFPGQMKRFTDGTNSYFVRFVQRETRQLHPSSDCFRGLGFTIEPRSISVEPDGTRWGTFEASKANSRYLILERIYDSKGRSSSDVSEWYWLALLGKTHGPWFAVTIAQPLQNGSNRPES
jgi:exosortase/archaeosortase family protein